MVTERTVVTEEIVVMGTVQRATAVGVTARMKMVTMTTGMRSPNTVAIGACSMPSSQKEDASMEDQTSQAEGVPAKNTAGTGTPVTQPPGKGASKRKGKMPRCKFPGLLQAGVQYTGPCLRKAVRYPNVNRKKPVLYLHPIYKQVTRKEALQNVGYLHRSWERAHEARREGRLVRIGWFRPGLWLYKRSGITRNLQRSLLENCRSRG